MAVTGFIWLLDSLILRKKRAADAAEPVLVEYAKSFFPVILLVFFVRSFIVEPFKIPSGSMMPTLLAGDYILVNKFTYGLRVPILNNRFLDVNEPKRGDVLCFITHRRHRSITLSAWWACLAIKFATWTNA